MQKIAYTRKHPSCDVVKIPRNHSMFLGMAELLVTHSTRQGIHDTYLIEVDGVREFARIFRQYNKCDLLHEAKEKHLIKENTNEVEGIVIAPERGSHG